MAQAQNKEGMVNSQLDKANKLYAIGMKAIKTQLYLIGTDFVVLRPKDNSKWKNVFGGTYSSDSTLESDYEQFTTKLIVNLGEMRDVWNRNRDTIESVTNDGSLEVGDELQYTREKRTYRFKIVQKQGYSETADVIYNYTLMSIIETLDE
jgi:hypothetical protein